MEFFGRIVIKAGRVLQLAAQPHLRTRDALELRRALEVVGQKVHHIYQQAPSALAQDPAEVVEQIHGTLEETLDAIERLFHRTTSPQILDPALLAPYPTALAVEIHKLEVLRCTLKISDAKSDDAALPAAITQRPTKVAKYIEFELGRCGLRQTNANDKLLTKWRKLNNYEYLQNISEDSLHDLKSLGQIVSAFGRCLHFAKAATCTNDDRWLYLAICARCLVLARSSSDYTGILKDGGLSALVIQDYLTELEMDLLAVFIESPTQYQTREWIAQRTQKQNPDEDRAKLSYSDSHSTVSANIRDDQDIFTWSCNMGSNQPDLHFGLRLGPEGFLFLRPSRWVTALEPLRSRDLREAHIIPYYGTLSHISYECDIIIKKKESSERESAPVRLYFKHAHQLRRFQHLLTGWVVKKDYGSGIPIRLRKKRPFADPVEYTGRLQLWDRYPEKSPDVTGSNMVYALTGLTLTNPSQTTVSSNATIRAAEALPFARISTVDGREALVTHRPPKTLLVLLEETPGRDILALSVPPPPSTKIDEKLCSCKDKGSNCSRCFIRDVQRVSLKVGRYEFPKEEKVHSWVEVTLGSKEVREIFTTDLRNRWDEYNTRLQQAIDNSKHVNQGHFNTHAYQQP